VLATLALCAFFLAEGATALFGARALQGDSGVQRTRPRSSTSATFTRNRHDPALILRRNIFNSELGDLTKAAVTEGGGAFVDGELVLEEGETVDRCVSRLRLSGTAVVPGDFERSLAVIVGSDLKAMVYQGAATVEDSTIRAIYSDSVLLQSHSGAVCRLAMFDGVEPVGRFTPKKAADIKKADRKSADKKRRRAVAADRNAGLTDEEIAQGIERVSDTNFNIQRTLLNKVLDSAGKLIGIAAIAPKMEGGKSIGMEIRGIRPDTLLTKLGIRNSDVLESVNGQPLSGPDDALDAYTTLRTSDKFTLSVQRDGKSVLITYNLN
jgi:general secretion pathway protein C